MDATPRIGIIRAVTLEGGPLDGRVVQWSGEPLLDAPVIAGTSRMWGTDYEEGDESRIVDVPYRQDPARPLVYVYAGECPPPSNTIRH